MASFVEFIFLNITSSVWIIFIHLYIFCANLKKTIPSTLSISLLLVFFYDTLCGLYPINLIMSVVVLVQLICRQSLWGDLVSIASYIIGREKQSHSRLPDSTGVKKSSCLLFCSVWGIFRNSLVDVSTKPFCFEVQKARNWYMFFLCKILVLSLGCSFHDFFLLKHIIVYLNIIILISLIDSADF